MRRFNGVSLQAVGDQGKKECWRKLRNETLTKVGQKLSEKASDKLAEVKIRHAELGKTLQDKGLTKIKKVNPRGGLR